MNKNVSKFHVFLKIGVCCLLFSLCLMPQAYSASIEELESRAEQLQSKIDKSRARQKEISEKLKTIEDKHQKTLSSVTADGLEGYEAKIAKGQKKKTTLSDVSAQSPEKKAEQSATTQSEKEKVKTISYPQQREPRYIAPSKTNKGRRPFTRSDNTYSPQEVHYAVRKNSEVLSYAKEAVQAYTGTTEENVFIFSDNIANYCQFDTNSLEKMSDCLMKLIEKRSEGTQSSKQQMNELYQESLIDTTTHAIADTARYKNDAAGHEKNVLVPLQEKSSKATDERGDIEVLTLTEMEEVKLLNKLILIYANQLALDAFRDFGTFEVNNRDLTNIDEAK